MVHPAVVYPSFLAQLIRVIPVLSLSLQALEKPAQAMCPSQLGILMLAMVGKFHYLPAPLGVRER
jgi:hypothetical protein